MTGHQTPPRAARGNLLGLVLPRCSSSGDRGTRCYDVDQVLRELGLATGRRRDTLLSSLQLSGQRPPGRRSRSAPATAPGSCSSRPDRVGRASSTPGYPAVPVANDLVDSVMRVRAPAARWKPNQEPVSLVCETERAAEGERRHHAKSGELARRPCTTRRPPASKDVELAGNTCGLKNAAQQRPNRARRAPVGERRVRPLFR